MKRKTLIKRYFVVHPKLSLRQGFIIYSKASTEFWAKGGYVFRAITSKTSWKSMVRWAKSKGIKIVSEGIEDKGYCERGETDLTDAISEVKKEQSRKATVVPKK